MSKPLSDPRVKRRDSPLGCTVAREKKAATPKALPVRFWQSRQ
jgi:hypothetical protein